MCWQLEASSLLLFSDEISGLNIITYFSFKHSWYSCMIGQNGLPLSMTFQLILKFMFCNLSSQMKVDNLVSCLYFSCLKDFWWFLYLINNGVELRPTYVSILPEFWVTVAWYTISENKFHQICSADGFTKIPHSKYL